MYRIGFIGFGEAAQAFTEGWRDAGLDARVSAYDLLFDAQEPGVAAAKNDDCQTRAVAPVATVGELVADNDIIVSAVTADQALAAATSVGELRAEQRYLDINSVAPEKKRAAAAALGTGYLDVAVLAPAYPRRHETPMLLGGPTAHAAGPALTEIFPAIEVFSDAVGEASLVKMIRSVFVKGMESVAMECALAAERAGLTERIFESLDNTMRFTTAREFVDYTTERVAVHGLRRSAEMEEVCATLEDLGLVPTMSQGAVTVQRMIGALDLQGELGEVPQDARAIATAALDHLAKA